MNMKISSCCSRACWRATSLGTQIGTAFPVGFGRSEPPAWYRTLCHMCTQCTYIRRNRSAPKNVRVHRSGVVGMGRSAHCAFMCLRIWWDISPLRKRSMSPTGKRGRVDSDWMCCLGLEAQTCSYQVIMFELHWYTVNFSHNKTVVFLNWIVSKIKMCFELNCLKYSNKPLSLHCQSLVIYLVDDQPFDGFLCYCTIIL